MVKGIREASKFELGGVYMSGGVNGLVADNGEFAKFVLASVRRHAIGDWGDMCQEDKNENELALRKGNLRIFSAYQVEGLPKIWIITGADRSTTTVLLPEEY